MSANTWRSAENGKKEKNTITDPIQATIGDFGRWQLGLCISLALLKVPVVWHQLAIVFLAPPVDFYCAQGSNRSTDHCHGAYGEECTVWEYDRSVFEETIVTEWNLVCSKAQLANVAQTIFMFGVLIGNVLFGWAADKYGRKVPLIISIVLQVFAGVATAFMPWYSIFLVFRFLDAVATGGTMITSFVVCMEILSHKWRAVISVMYHLPFAMGHIVLSGVSYFLRDWRGFQLGISVPTIVFLIYGWIIPESPRWLLAVGQEKEAIEILKQAARRNRKDPELIEENLHNSKHGEAKQESKGNILDLFRTPNMRLKTLCIYYNWFVCGFCFFGLVQYMGHIGGNIFINITIGGLLELPGAFTCIYVMERFGRRTSLATAQFIAGVSCLLILAVPLGPDADTWPKVVLSSLGMLGMSVAFPTVYLYSGEIFPTVVRNVGVGSASMCARVGSMVAPFVTSLGDWSPYYPPLLFGAVPLIAGGLCFLLPETVGTVLPDTVEEAEAISRKTPPQRVVDGYINQEFKYDETEANHQCVSKM